MARKGHIAKRETLADPMYNSVLVSKLVNQIMLDGKKGVAQKIVYNAFAPRGKGKTYRWCNIPGSDRSSSGQTPGSGSALADQLLQKAF